MDFFKVINDAGSTALLGTVLAAAVGIAARNKGLLLIAGGSCTPSIFDNPRACTPGLYFFLLGVSAHNVAISVIIDIAINIIDITMFGILQAGDRELGILRAIEGEKRVAALNSL